MRKKRRYSTPLKFRLYPKLQLVPTRCAFVFSLVCGSLLAAIGLRFSAVNAVIFPSIPFPIVLLSDCSSCLPLCLSHCVNRSRMLEPIFSKQNERSFSLMCVDKRKKGGERRTTSLLILVRRRWSLLIQQGPNVRVQSKQLQRSARSNPNEKIILERCSQ